MHFGYGRLAVAGRLLNFARLYDLAERVLPPEQFRRRVPPEDAQRELVHQAARAQGVAAAGDLADYFRMPLREVRARISELVESRQLSEVRVESWREPGYLDPKARLPKRIDASALLSPFDPVVWHNPRSARLFDFDYRIELFVKKPQRKWGYYVLPFLLGDRLVARVDLKADRKGSNLLVLAAYLESHAKPGPVAGALVAELETMAAWLELDSVSVGQRGNLARSIADALRTTTGGRRSRGS